MVSVAGCLGFESFGGYNIYLSSKLSIVVLERTLPPVQWLPGVHSTGVKLSDSKFEYTSIL
jgi:hypothetical protein